LSSEFQVPIQPQSPGKFSNGTQRRAPIGAVINYTLEGVSIHPITTKIQAPFLIQLPERKETAEGFHREANDDFKPATEFNGCDRR
jgi:hypothetical protein